MGTLVIRVPGHHSPGTWYKGILLLLLFYFLAGVQFLTRDINYLVFTFGCVSQEAVL
jgi:hypothetical protein